MRYAEMFEGTGLSLCPRLAPPSRRAHTRRSPGEGSELDRSDRPGSASQASCSISQSNAFNRLLSYIHQ